MPLCRILHTLLVAAVLSLAPSAARAQLGYWVPCTGSKAEAEGRNIDIRRYLNVNTVGMQVSDIEDLYCVTRAKCVALGHCTAATPAEQAAADTLKQDIAAEEARLQRERQAKAAEEERQRKEIAAAAEKARRERLVAAEAQRLRLSSQEAQRLVDAREQADKQRPPQPTTCTLDYPAYSEKLDFSPGLYLHSQAQKDYAAMDRSKVCGGHPGTLDPLQCTQPVNLFGASFASCTASLRCPARQETKPCTRTSAQ